MTTRSKIKQIIEKTIGKKAEISRPLPAFGDYSTNVAIQAKIDSVKAASKLQKAGQGLFEKVESKNGFINFFLAKQYLRKQVAEILEKGKDFGNLNIGRGKKAQIEFISANPTGPLTLGNGRGGFCGDVLANVLQKVGYRVEREYYINDRGEQIIALGHSVLGDGKAVYRGDYIIKLRKYLSSCSNAEEAGKKAAKEILEKMLKPAIERMGIKYDVWFSETKELYQSGEVDEVLTWLKKRGLAYEKDRALWFVSKKFGDDKDRVLVKADGEKTYFASDIAYLKNKFERGFDKLIWFLGADHYGYVGRMKAAVEALGYKKEQTRFIIMQLVKLFKQGKEVRMAKRQGVYVTLDELFDELCQKNPLGRDVARFFFLSRQANTHLNFDMDLAKEQSEKNPVYYIQYAHTRIQSILTKTKKKDIEWSITKQTLELLDNPSELSLAKQLIRLPEVIEDTAQDYQVQRLPKYATDLAAAFHRFYTDCRVIDETNKELTGARLALVKATGIVLKNTLNIMGITAPAKM